MMFKKTIFKIHKIHTQIFEHSQAQLITVVLLNKVMLKGKGIRNEPHLGGGGGGGGSGAWRWR